MFKRIQFIFFFILISFTQMIHVQSEELDVDQLLQKLESIESRIKVLEKATFSKTTSGIGNNVSLDDYQSIITKQSIQIAELQNEVQSLTAKIEEMILHVAHYSGFPTAVSASQLLNKVWDEEKES